MTIDNKCNRDYQVYFFFAIFLKYDWQHKSTTAGFIDLQIVVAYTTLQIDSPSDEKPKVKHFWKNSYEMPEGKMLANISIKTMQRT